MSTASVIKTCCTVATVIMFISSAFAYSALSNEGLKLRIVHTNDMHSRFEETSKLSTVCTPKDSKEGNCYGGFARIATLVREARKSKIPALFLNAGDTYQGTVWFSIFKWKIVSQFLNILTPDAISLGNHEFDDGISGLIPFIENASYPIVTCNLDLRNQLDLKATKLLNSTVLTVNGTKIGVIGYLTPDTKRISKSENVIFRDEVESIREEAKRLKEQGIEILIALGHSGFETDKKIARDVEDIDLVIGGHTNTFLYNGDQPSVETPEGFYPTVVVQESGRKTYVVQAYAYTKYLGNLMMVFDNRGEITSITGNPILVNSSIEQAPDVLEELDRLRPAIANLTLTEVGKTHVLLDGDSKTCRRDECNLGNLITDAMIDYNAGTVFVQDGWTDAAIAIQNGGSIRTSITRNNNDRITLADVLAVLPFNNAIVKVIITGADLLAILEQSVSTLESHSSLNLFGGFLQYSGIQVTYDLCQPKYSRVVSALVQCSVCDIPAYYKLQLNETYNVLIPHYLYVGGDNYTIFKNFKSTSLGITMADALVEYLKKQNPVYTGIQGRINYVQKSTFEYNSGITSQPMRILILITVTPFRSSQALIPQYLETDVQLQVK
ncbi:hypothetical protein KM043_011408 [Ampulex compressa]|nr:hypothetical protein KM043_011408 [Ampulex compressa]